MTDKCVYCGELEATTTIPDPNGEPFIIWKVCEPCKETINYQMMYSISERIGNKKMMNFAIKKLDEIAEKTGIPYMICGISKKGEE